MSVLTAIPSLLEVGEVAWIDPAIIEYRVSPISDLRGIVGGNWDRDRLYRLSETVKYQAIREHFIDGRPWEETNLFRDIYTRRLRTNHVRGETTLEALAAQYYSRVDGLAESMRRDGFLTHRKDGQPHPLPGFYIGRSGQVFIGNQGNHRLSIAQVLGLPKIAGEIVCRHRFWSE